MIYDELKATYDRKSGSWPEDARAFSGMLLAVINQLEHRIQKLEDQISKNSRNSSKPPSLDLNRPVKRKSSVNVPKRDPGRQRGHQGKGGKLKDNLDIIVSHKLGDCPDCGHDLREVAVEGTLCRQIEDISLIKTEVTEYQTKEKTFLVCITCCQAGRCAQHHEFEYSKWGRTRINALLEVFGVQLSTGTLNNLHSAASKQLDGFKAGLNQALADYFEETGISVRGENHWVHVASSKMCSMFGIYLGRGKNTHKAMRILPEFTGIVHRDAYRPYDDYAQKQDSQCSAHIIRDLEFVIERHGQKARAELLKKQLLKADNNVLKSKQGIVSKIRFFRIRNKYRMLVKKDLDVYPALTRTDTQTKGATKLVKPLNYRTFDYECYKNRK
jgi:transposase